ncbi:hypothetical protein BNJ_00445 [Kaumoebavirus]|uniref:hypothetical protein n=1 Tax=Kaumoebavirus TaxID=1859492 RepID=UPI0009C21411|nr:hypothetical protein BNJ_00445 [Kaumoebavirus]ARA72257.1 hypothetical protein BNJ_00445 [Kaumoebavirus]
MKVCAYTKNEAKAPEVLKKVAIDFIKSEEGEKKAENCLVDDSTNMEKFRDGYFLRYREVNGEPRYYVGKKETKTKDGYIWSSYSSKVVDIGYFAKVGYELPKKLVENVPAESPILEKNDRLMLWEKMMNELKGSSMFMRRSVVANLEASTL